jgi:tubulin-specific chaperone A
VFEPLRRRIADAVEKLEEQIAIAESDGTGPEEELTKARAALEAGQKVSEEGEQKEQGQQDADKEEL